MRLDLKEKNSTQILELLNNTHIEDGQILELELLASDVDAIGFKAFVDLAQLFFMKLLTPIQTDRDTIKLRFYKLNKNSSFHKADSKDTEKYGVDSEFFTIDKTKEFSFLYHYQKALQFINIDKKMKILNLGVNKADEFRVIKDLLPDANFFQKEFIGIDYSNSIIDYAKEHFSYKNVDFISHDINKLDELDLGRFDLIISIGTLQSSNINFNTTFMSLYQNYLQKDGAIILGFPNCRWIDGEMIYGAKAPNYAFSEMSLVLKDIHFCKKYLQQKKYRVTITGKDYLFLTARKIGI